MIAEVSTTGGTIAVGLEEQSFLKANLVTLHIGWCARLYAKKVVEDTTTQLKVKFNFATRHDTVWSKNYLLYLLTLGRFFNKVKESAGGAFHKLKILPLFFGEIIPGEKALRRVRKRASQF
nr:hypothetical protein BAU18_13730 [Enterococcus diestrammenae]